MNKENDPSNQESHSAELNWIERHVNLFIVGLGLACVATLAAQAWYGDDLFHGHSPHFPQESILGFEAAFGFLAFGTVVFLGRLLRLIVMRKEDYYDS